VSNLVDDEDAFFALCAPHVERFNAAGSWNTLGSTTQELVGLFRARLDVPNGGYLQFFCNHGPVAHRCAVRALLRLKAHDAANALERGAAALLPFEDDERVTTLWELARIIDDATARILDEASDAFCAAPDWCADAVAHYGAESVS
jgi:hypothetical protein